MLFYQNWAIIAAKRIILKPVFTKNEVLKYHEYPRAGKTAIKLTKPVENAKELSIAYSPGVALPCLEIERDKNLAYRYTNRANLVAVISDATAVLGLGKLRPEASKPVMEGKAVLFKKFAFIDAFDIELNVREVDDIVKVISAMTPTFGGINLEDISAPRCFEIERRLQEICDIPVFHDDQHGTAIISAAAIINGLSMVGKRLQDVKIVIIGAGAAGIAAARMYDYLGAKNIILVDSKGPVTRHRKDLNPYKADWAVSEDIKTLAEALKGADVVIGNSKADIIDEDMVKSLAKDALLFTLANPDPEIKPQRAKAVRDDLIIATGRSDYPNQVNNVLGFPFIFRGALDIRASKINMEMKKAAVYALANLAKKEVPSYVKRAYKNADISYGREYILPKPFDRRVFVDVSVAVAKAGIKSGVSRLGIEDEKSWIEGYKKHLVEMLKEEEGIDYF